MFFVNKTSAIKNNLTFFRESMCTSTTYGMDFKSKEFFKKLDENFYYKF